MIDVHGKKYGVYVHIPFCKSKCKYCSFVSTPDLSLRRAYVAALIGEIERCELSGVAVDTIYVGGGTPSCLEHGELSRIFSIIYNTFYICPSAEITVECNPESVSAEFVTELVALGVNRVGIGMQSASNDVLAAAGRAHTHEQYLYALELLCNDIENISTDIILGLPKQTIEDVDRAIDCASRLKHISVYALSVEQGTQLFESGYSADEDLIADFYDFAVKKLSNSGFVRYEVSNFAKLGYESRHNNKYWNSDPYIGFGVASHGYDGNYTRYAHGDDIFGYIKNHNAGKIILTDKDRYNEYVMLRLRTERGIVCSDFENRFGYSFAERNSAALEKLVAEKSVIYANGCIKIAPDRMFVMNSIIEQLML